MKKSFDGCYTRTLRAAFNVRWRDHPTNEELYLDIPQVSAKIFWRKMQLAGHSFRNPELPSDKVLLWNPTNGHRGRGQPAATYP